tara:strand:+ start:414 stop:974 length:561 start_codon:yes stop_codon:yes gene_type:complete
MTKRKEQASQPLQLGETKVDFVADREVFDVKEAEILVSKRSPGRISDGFARVFSSVNGWQGMPAAANTDDLKKGHILEKVKFIGIAVTGHRAERIAKFDQGFVACISGIVTVMNESAETMHPGTPLTFDVCTKYPIQHGIHARKVRFHFRKAGTRPDGTAEPVVAKALSYSKKGSTVDILLHPQKY